MSKIEKIEDLVIWQRGRELNKVIYEITSEGSFAKDFALRDQIRRASISITSNIAEGFERKGNGEFKYFLSVAKGSLGELRSQLYLAMDLKYFDEKKFDELNSQSVELSKMIGSFINYLKTHSSTTRNSQPVTRNA